MGFVVSNLSPEQEGQRQAQVYSDLAGFTSGTAPFPQGQRQGSPAPVHPPSLVKLEHFNGHFNACSLLGQSQGKNTELCQTSMLPLAPTGWRWPDCPLRPGSPGVLVLRRPMNSRSPGGCWPGSNLILVPQVTPRRLAVSPFFPHIQPSLQLRSALNDFTRILSTSRDLPKEHMGCSRFLFFVLDVHILRKFLVSNSKKDYGGFPPFIYSIPV